MKQEPSNDNYSKKALAYCKVFFCVALLKIKINMNKLQANL
jgi:hypothetical protein